MKSRILSVVLCVPLLAAPSWPTVQDADALSGQAALAKGDFEGALRLYRKASGEEGAQAQRQFNLGTVLVYSALQAEEIRGREAKLDLAILSFGRAAAAPQQPLGNALPYNLGNALLLRGRHEEAIVSYRKVLRNDPSHDGARHNLELALLAKRAAETGERDAAPLGQSPTTHEVGPSSANVAKQGGTQQPSTSSTNGSRAKQPASKPEGNRASELDKATSEQANSAEQGPKAKAQDAKPLPASPKNMSLQQKLDALERRSGELRRANMLRKTEARRRNPGQRAKDQ